MYDNTDPNNPVLVGTGVADAQGNYSVVTTPLQPDATYPLSVTQTDLGGNTSAPVSAGNWTIDTTPPASPAITSYSQDTGTTGDGVTSDTDLSLSGTAEPGTSVAVYDNGTLIGTVVADHPGVVASRTAIGGTRIGNALSHALTVFESAASGERKGDGSSATPDAQGKAQAKDLALDNEQGVALYDPNVHYEHVRSDRWDWHQDPRPESDATRTVNTTAQDAKVPPQPMP